MTLLHQRPGPAAHDPAVDRAEALIREARRRQRRRRVAVCGLVLVVTGAAIAAVVVAPGSGAPGRGLRAGSRHPVAGPPSGRAVSLELAGPLAVGPDGRLYVADLAHHEVLVRQPDGGFRVVAGNGKDGFAGDGGPATDAELSDVTDLAVGAGGDLYIAGGGRVRVVSRAGTIRTVAGDGGGRGRVPSGTPARSAPLGRGVAVAVGPAGTLYVATTSQLFRMAPDGTLRTVRAVVTSGPGPHGPLGSFGQIAVDGNGDIDASSLYRGWSAYTIAPDGVATYLGYARRDGGAPSSLAAGPGGVVDVESGSTVLRVEGDELVPVHAFDHVPGTAWFTLSSFAVAPDGTVYADDLGMPALQRVQQLVAVSHGRTTVLWHHANRS